MIRPAPRPAQNEPPLKLNAPGVKANACAPLKCVNAATIVLSTAASMTTNSTVVRLPIWPILRNSATMITRTIAIPMILPSAVLPASSVTPGTR